MGLKPPDTACLGQWNAWVEKGGDRYGCFERLKQCPERHREQVISHVKLVLHMKGLKNENSDI